jgi:putative transposase
MARLPRLFIPGVPVHVIIRGNNRQDVFRGDGDRVFFHRCLAEQAGQHDVSVHAYVLMTNHIHLLAMGARARSIPALVQSLGRRYVGYFNYLHHRTGTLWEGRYKAGLVQAERYLLTCQRYIELNPVRAGMVRHPGQFAWSSFHRCAHGQPDDAVTPHPLYEDLAIDPERRLAAYRELFEHDIDYRTLHKIRDAVHNGWVLGDAGYLAKIAREALRRPARVPVGRKARISLTGV